MQTKKKMPSLTDSKSESLHFLHNSHPVSRGVSYTLIKFWALITKKFLYLTRSYNLLIFYIALPLCTTVFIPAYTCFRLNTEEKLVRGLDLRILNGSTVIYKTLFETNFSLRFERVYKLIFEDRIRPVHIDVKKVMKIPMSRDVSVRQDTHHSVDLILVGCKLITNMTGRNDSWIIAFYNSQFDYAEILSISTYISDINKDACIVL
ncbi:hypothetical protein BgiBS90_027366 [Biomphalaria glabrata]|nr:hypothetical protein BgiBS90_027366 [Biomphalaria glabrata]